MSERSPNQAGMTARTAPGVFLPPQTRANLRAVRPSGSVEDGATLLLRCVLDRYERVMERWGVTVQRERLLAWLPNADTFARVVVMRGGARRGDAPTGGDEGERAVGFVVARLLAAGAGFRERTLWVDDVYGEGGAVPQGAPAEGRPYGVRAFLFDLLLEEMGHRGIREMAFESARPGMTRLARRYGARVRSVTYVLRT